MTNLVYEPATYLRYSPGNRWLFRWVFEFHDKKRKAGGWYPATRLEDKASTVNKTGLARALIEGKHFLTKEIKTFAEVPGEDFINFEHLALLISNSGRQYTHVYGMRIQARDCIMIATENGAVRYEPRELKGDHLYPSWTRV